MMPDSLSEILDRVGGSQRLVPVLIGVAAVVSIFGFARWGLEPDWVPVTRDLPMERVGEASQRLDEAGVDHRLGRGGTTITVKEPDAARARVVLAGEGFAGGDPSRPGFELFDEPAWGMTDFTQRINFRRALEGELERTIGRMRDVREAQVHLALQETSFLGGGNTLTEASVVLRLASGARPEDSMVEGIQFLVASSVQDLDPADVMVLDDRGRLLSTPEEDGGSRLSLQRLQVRSETEKYLERKAEAVLHQVVGPGNGTVRVAADLNFDRLDRTVERLETDQQVLVSEDRSEITPGTEEQGAGSVTVNNVYETPRTVETFSQGGGRLERLTVAVVVADREVGEEDGPASWEPRSPEELERVRRLVANAVGLDESRGDEISVASMPPETSRGPLVPEEGIDLLTVASVVQRPLLAVLAVLMAYMIATRVLRRVPRAPATSSRALEEASEDRERLPSAAAEPERIQPPAERYRLEDPEMTAKVLKSWLKEA